MVAASGGSPGGDDPPLFGHGRDGRPLASRRERDAEVIREILRLARRRERTASHGGFVVEGTGGHSDEPFVVACQAAPDVGLNLSEEVRAYISALRRCAYQVSEHLRVGTRCR